jgi:hypothetical protein
MQLGGENIYLVQKTIRRIGDDAHNTLLANIAAVDDNRGLAEVTETALLHNWEDLLPARLGLLVGGDAEQPVGLLVGGPEGNGLAADVEVDDLVAREVGSKAAAGRGALVVVAETDGLGVFEDEVGRGGAVEGGGREEGSGAHFDC